MRILDALFHHAQSAPNRPAMALADRIVTYDMMARGILSCEARGKLSGVRAGDLVAVALVSPIRNMILTLALMRLGAVPVSVDEADSTSVKQLEPDWVLVDDFEDVESTTRAHQISDDWFHGFNGPLSAASPAYTFDEDEVCRIVMSSGSTGVPKPFAFSQRILSDRIYTRVFLNASCSSERTLMAAPISSQMGWTGALASIATGSFVLFALTPETTLQMIDIYGVTNLVVTANQISKLLEFKKNADFTTNSLRSLQIGGGIVTAALGRALQSEFCHHVVCRYGSTESGIIAYAEVGVLSETEHSVGRIAPWARAEVLDDTGQVQRPGRQGLLRVSAGSLAPPWSRGMRYCTTGDLWFDTGDIATLNLSGMLAIHGRATNVLNIGGVKVSYEHVEARLLREGGIREAGVFSIVGSSGMEELWASVAGEGIDRDQVLENVNREFFATPIRRLFIFPKLPRNAGGKLLRAELSRLALAHDQ